MVVGGLVDDTEDGVDTAVVVIITLPTQVPADDPAPQSLPK